MMKSYGNLNMQIWISI